MELARRWLAALTLVPEPEREAIVEAVERQLAREFGDAHQPPGQRGAGHAPDATARRGTGRQHLDGTADP